MKNYKKSYLICLMVFTIVLSACDNKNVSQNNSQVKEKIVDEGYEMADRLLKEEGISSEQKSHISCLKLTRQRLTPLAERLTQEHKLALAKQFELIEESSEECSKAFDMVIEIENEFRLNDLATDS